MITFLEGTVEEKQPTRVVLNVGGVGYEVFVPLTCYDRIPGAGGACRLLTYEHIREDQHALFGFVSTEERRMFEMLLGISGIGPRLALSALSGLSVRELKRAVVDGDVKRLSAVKGIGRKTAERLVVELRNRMDASEAVEAVAGPAESADAHARLRDAVMALVSLGHSQADAQKMVRNLIGERAAGLTVEEIVREALAQQR